MLAKFLNRKRRHAKVRSKISGTDTKPRLAIYRSNSNIYAQIIDDTSWKTLASSNDLKIKEWTKSERAKKVWSDIAEKAKTANISSVVFDKWGFKYHWRVKSLADSARETGLAF